MDKEPIKQGKGLIKTEVKNDLGDKVLLVTAEEYKDAIPSVYELMYVLGAWALALTMGISVGMVGDIFLILFVSRFVAPAIASGLLQQEVQQYVHKNKDEMTSQSKGSLTFALYSRRYVLSWNTLIKEKA